MSYRIEWEQDASDALDRLDASVAQRILLRIGWLAANFDNVKPQVLTASLSGYFKLRVGAYRVLYTVNREDRVLIIEYVGHCRDIHKLS